MITFQQMATLIKQGYNEDQIKQINAIFSPDQDGPTPNPEPITTPNPAPAPAPATEKPETQPAPGTAAPEPQTQPPTQPEPQQESETQKMLREMLGIMRTGAINTMQQPTNKPVTTESILAKVLEP